MRRICPALPADRARGAMITALGTEAAHAAELALPDVALAPSGRPAAAARTGAVRG
ncbi:hypothetical protein [Kitasatospora sp. NPDC056184]|uniref:hypothetical protein n=1 Tax=Kitasatospora sp. NPDC056184 TaxID=3345738 RepID=UPI0035D62BD7